MIKIHLIRDSVLSIVNDNDLHYLYTSSIKQIKKHVR